MKRREKRGNISASLDSQKCKRERKSERRRRDRDRARERRNKTNQLTSPTGRGETLDHHHGQGPGPWGVSPGSGVRHTEAPQYPSASKLQPLPGVSAPSLQPPLDQKGWLEAAPAPLAPSEPASSGSGCYGGLIPPSHSPALGP